jgi:hypothetical protein
MRIGERGARRMKREIGGDFAGCRDMALANAGALHDPFVGRLDSERARSSLVRILLGR